MVWPYVSIFWLNYNSSNMIDIVLESLESVLNLDYPSFELIIIDNASTDDSWELINNYIKKHNINLKIKSVKLNKNWGFTGGNNIAYRLRNPQSKYIVLLNNDAIVLSDSLRKMVEYMENDEYIGGLQGIILDYYTNKIDNAGFYMNELLRPHAIFGGYFPNIKHPFYVTYVSGAYSIYRVQALLKANLKEKLFDEDVFAFYDDNVLGLKLWNIDYRVLTIPYIVAKHAGGITFGKNTLKRYYHGIMGWTVLNEVSNSRYKHILRSALPLFALKSMTYLWSAKESSKRLLQGYINGLKIGRKKKMYGEKIDIYKAPILKIPIWAVIPFIFKRDLLNSYLNRKIIELQKNNIYSNV